jgi:hypothetical protein
LLTSSARIRYGTWSAQYVVLSRDMLYDSRGAFLSSGIETARRLLRPFVRGLVL